MHQGFHILRSTSFLGFTGFRETSDFSRFVSTPVPQTTAWFLPVLIPFTSDFPYFITMERFNRMQLVNSSVRCGPLGGNHRAGDIKRPMVFTLASPESVSTIYPLSSEMTIRGSKEQIGSKFWFLTGCFVLLVMMRRKIHCSLLCLWFSHARCDAWSPECEHENFFTRTVTALATEMWSSTLRTWMFSCANIGTNQFT